MCFFIKLIRIVPRCVDRQLLAARGRFESQCFLWKDGPTARVERTPTWPSHPLLRTQAKHVLEQSRCYGEMRQVASEKCTLLYWYVMITDTESAMDATATGLGNYLNELMGMYQRILEHLSSK